MMYGGIWPKTLLLGILTIMIWCIYHIYRNASDDNDCPLITDTSTPACGRSRFGCWVCTVVSSDKSMQNLIATGDTWMRPLLEFRNMLAETIHRDSPNYEPQKYRMPIRRNTQVGLGPYWPRWRQYILEQLLITQKEVNKTIPGIRLITEQELVAIQVIWNRDFISEYGVAETYSKVYGSVIESLDFITHSYKEKHLLQEVCVNHKSDVDLISSLLRAHKNKILLRNKRGLQKDVESVLDEYINPTFTDVYKKDKTH